jgi:sterol desaturase/sphingolipid hydroxylase (fatty acid hydroxylase superfamily)
MHKVHHSRISTETNSNYSSLFSWWDRLAQTFRQRADPQQIEFGLREFDAPSQQTLPGLLRTPFAAPRSGS